MVLPLKFRTHLVFGSPMLLKNKALAKKNNFTSQISPLFLMPDQEHLEEITYNYF
jgi:hypothetical protein